MKRRSFLKTAVAGALFPFVPSVEPTEAHVKFVPELGRFRVWVGPDDYREFPARRGAVAGSPYVSLGRR